MNTAENIYFKAVVKEAVEDLRTNGSAFVFFQEQVDAVKEIIKEDVKVEYDGTFFRITKRVKDIDKKD